MAIPDQAPDSTVEGYLQGIDDRPGQIHPGNPLENYLQQLVAGVAGIEETLVRPRWQAQPPNLPDKSVTWLACGISQRRTLGYGAIVHQGWRARGQGEDMYQRHEEIDYDCTFYGPDGDFYAENLHDGMEQWQNRSRLHRVGLAYVGAGDRNRNPELIKGEWVERSDKTLVFRRIIVRDYPVRNLLGARARLHTDQVTDYAVTASVLPRP